MKFRYDINGLRAIAVLAVVVFHFNPTWLPGGFAGVDVFFVISGFLMTSIIFTGVEKNTFNLFKFYTARANRIIPVLAVVAIVLIIFGWFYLLPTDYRDLGKQVEKSLFFTSNILFSKGGGYFDTNEKTKWLLHTWSLSVEWQFYIFFPIIIIALKKHLSFANLKRVVIGLFLISFIYCIYATNKDSKTSYFLLTSRAWEMLLGGLAFLYPISIQNLKLRITTQIFGLILIISSYFLISKHTPWPGYMAIFPVLGAYLIILSNHQNNFIINNYFFSKIGKWSYSIYVWHWPIVVLGVYLTIPNWWMYGIPLSIFLGFLSYQFIEKIKFPTFQLWREIYKVKPFYMFLIILICGYTIKKTDGMEFHYSDKIQNIASDMNIINPYKCDSQLINNEIYKCKIGNQNNLKAIVVGDSHADALTTSVSTAINLKNSGIISLSTSGCPYILNAKFNDSNCDEVNIKRQKFLKENKGVPIILINRYLERLEGENDSERLRSDPPAIYFTNKNMTKNELYSSFDKNLKFTICDLTKVAPVYIVSPIPEIGFNVPKKMSKQLLINKKLEDNSIDLYQYKARTIKLDRIVTGIVKDCGAKILDPSKILCKTGKCITQYKERSIYRDGDHLSEYGNKLLTPIFKTVL